MYGHLRPPPSPGSDSHWEGPGREEERVGRRGEGGNGMGEGRVRRDREGRREGQQGGTVFIIKLVHTTA